MMRNKLRTWKFTVAYPVLLWCLSVGLAYGASNGEKVKIKGVMVAENRRRGPAVGSPTVMALTSPLHFR
jgi:hypothetical protein